MPELMRSPVTALMLDIWTRRRSSFLLVAATAVFACLFNLAFADSFGRTPNGVHLLRALNVVFLLTVAVFLLMIFSYQEFKSSKGSTGFPARFFPLPLTSLQLVAIPMGLGVTAIGLFWLLWMTSIRTFGQSTVFLGILLGAWLVWSQTVLWLPASDPFRLTTVGTVWMTFAYLALSPAYPQDALQWWLKGNTVIGLLIGSAPLAFVLSWTLVARQRSGRFNRRPFHGKVERISGILPGRIATFASPAAAQCWFEWRRSGYQLPRLVGVLLIGTLLVMLGIPWLSPGNTEDAREGLVVWTLTMPIILAFLAGKPLSKPDFWASDLAVPPFLAAKPLATEEIVTAKMKAAAWSTALSWLLVLAFLAASFPLWAYTDVLPYFRIVWWQFHDYPLLFQYAIGAASLLGCMFLTWRFLVAGLWLGLSGSRKMRALSAGPFVLIPALLIAIHEVIDKPAFSWVDYDLDRTLSFLIWTAAVGAIAKLWLSAFSWRNVARARVRQYLIFWTGGTACVVALAIVVSPLVWGFFLPSDGAQVRTLLILAALLAVPFARPGLATSSLERNRHR
jgi:hypothetical protein